MPGVYLTQHAESVARILGLSRIDIVHAVEDFADWSADPAGSGIFKTEYTLGNGRKIAVIFTPRDDRLAVIQVEEVV